VKLRQRRPRVCFIAPDIWPVLSASDAPVTVGGAEVQQSILARQFCRAGLPTTVVTKLPIEESTTEYRGIRIINITRRSREIPIIRNVHPRLTVVWRALERADADIYYCRCAGANVFVAGLFSRRYRRKFVYSAASDLDLQKNEAWKLFRGRGGWRDRQLYSHGLRYADAIIAQHSSQVETCQNSYGRTPVEIPNCYEPPPLATARKDGVVLWAATIKSVKRPERFLALARNLPEIRFRMIGGPGPGDEAPMFERIQRAAVELPNVDFVGPVPFAEAERHFNQARLFVNTSESEGFPNTFLQSWARGIPTVSFFDCQAREKGEPIGFVCVDTNAMTARVAQLAKDDTLWAEAGNRARRYHREHHSVDTAVGRYLRLFASLYPVS
jgi:glycosyltransferase involved in cell wall biosynthesis